MSPRGDTKIFRQDSTMNIPVDLILLVEGIAVDGDGPPGVRRGDAGIPSVKGGDAGLPGVRRWASTAQG